MTTLTSGLSASIVCRAESTFLTPRRSVEWMTWRWRLLASTTSKSTMPSVPTPAAARYSAAGLPSPPAPMISTFDSRSFAWPVRPDLGDQQVAAVARLLGRRQGRRRLDRQVVRLPLEDPAGHVDDVRVAERLELRRGPAGARAAAAVQDDLGVLVGHGRGDRLVELRRAG